jgi:hypothetical protein
MRASSQHTFTLRVSPPLYPSSVYGAERAAFSKGALGIPVFHRVALRGPPQADPRLCALSIHRRQAPDGLLNPTCSFGPVANLHRFNPSLCRSDTASPPVVKL